MQVRQVAVLYRGIFLTEQRLHKMDETALMRTCVLSTCHGNDRVACFKHHAHCASKRLLAYEVTIPYLGSIATPRSDRTSCSLGCNKPQTEKKKQQLQIKGEKKNVLQLQDTNLGWRNKEKRGLRLTNCPPLVLPTTRRCSANTGTACPLGPLRTHRARLFLC